MAQKERDRALTAESQARTNQVKAETEADRAKRSAAESRAVLGFFLNRVVAAARPGGQAGGQGYDVTLRAALDAAERAITADFAAQPKVEAVVRKTLGESYFFLGDAAKAVEQLEAARTLGAPEIGPDRPEWLELLDNLAVAYHKAGRTGDAIKLKREMFELRSANQGPDHPDTVQSMFNLAEMYLNSGRIDDAVRLSEEVLRLRKAKLGPTTLTRSSA